MPAPTTANSHITIDADGVARIDDTRMKVLHIAAEVVARGATAEQLKESFPHLALAQIHAALAYYYDHQAQFDAQLARESAEYEAARAAQQQEDGPLRRKLRGLKRDNP